MLDSPDLRWTRRFRTALLVLLLTFLLLLGRLGRGQDVDHDDDDAYYTPRHSFAPHHHRNLQANRPSGTCGFCTLEENVVIKPDHLIMLIPFKREIRGGLFDSFCSQID